MRRFAALLLALPLAGLAAGVAEYVRLPGGSFRTALKYEDRKGAAVRIAPFDLMKTPVTNGQFLAFVQTHPEWRRDHVARVMADARYLGHWRSPATFTDATQAQQPVTQVSWFAAQAYCEAEGGRLPTWSEWEYAAAADATRRDARADPAWRARILGWYSRPATGPLPKVGGAPNVYGVRDLHGVVWEWVDDFNALLVDGDSRTGKDPDKLKFCGAGAIDLQDRENYAVLMRVALLSSLNASDSTGSLGFRCVHPTH
jgi:sulfatase modifying factor 1